MSPAVRDSVADSLHMRFVQALARRVPAGAMGNLALLCGLVLVTARDIRHPALAATLFAWMTGVTIWRLQVARAARELREEGTRRWLRRFAASTIAAGLTWGVLTALWLMIHGLEPLSVLVVVTLAGVVSAAAHVSAPSLVVLRAFSFVALAPSIVVLLVHRPSEVSAGLAVALGLYGTFLWFQGRLMHADFLVAQTRAYRLQKQSAQLRRSREALREQATRDALTGALNRGAGLAALDRELDRARRERRALAVVMIDVDHFKRVNDEHGHAAGDAVLRECAARFQRELRPYDFLARLGGEEFLLVLPGCDRECGVVVAERLRYALANEVIQAGGSALRITASFGVAVATSADDSGMLVARADEHLYGAKRSGRNQTQAA